MNTSIRTYRPFSKYGANIGQAASATVTLLDTDGSRLDCTYIKVVAGKIDWTGHFLVLIPGASRQMEVLYVTSNMPLMAGHGTYGSGGIVELFLDDQDSTDTIEILNLTSTTQIFHVQYGVEKSRNPIRDESRPKGT